MPSQDINNPLEFSTILRKLETSDPGHADVFNPLFKLLINNDAFMKFMLDQNKNNIDEIKDSLTKIILSETEPEEENNLYWLQDVGEDFSLPTGDGIVMSNAGFEDDKDIKFEEL